MTQEHEYEVRLHTGKVLGPLMFADLPQQFKALSWLYAYRRSGAATIAYMFLVNVAQERADRVHSPR